MIVCLSKFFIYFTEQQQLLSLHIIDISFFLDYSLVFYIKRASTKFHLRHFTIICNIDFLFKDTFLYFICIKNISDKIILFN